MPRENRSSRAAKPASPTVIAESLGTENLDASSCAWVGLDGTLDPTMVLQEHGHDPDSPLELVILAIIDAHESKRRREDRLEIAWEALTGEKRKRGMNSKDDYSLLLEIAQLFHKAHVNGRGQTAPKVAPIVNRVVDRLFQQDKTLGNADRVSVVRRLERKFNKQRDILLSRVTSMTNDDRMARIIQTQAVVQQMIRLGIPADLKAVRPKTVSTD